MAFRPLLCNKELADTMIRTCLRGVSLVADRSSQSSSKQRGDRTGSGDGVEARPVPGPQDALRPDKPRKLADTSMDVLEPTPGPRKGEGGARGGGVKRGGKQQAPGAGNKRPGGGPANQPGGPNKGGAKQGGQKAPAPQPAPTPVQAAPVSAPAPAPSPAPATAPRAATRGRHWMAVLTFLLMVVTPASLTAWYLWERAVDQYASFVGFSVRTEEVGSAVELLGGITELTGSSSSDTDILYEFLQGQELVAAIDKDLDLRRIWSRASPEIDPVFAYHPPGTIEDLVDHWERKVKIYYDAGTGLLDLRILAFDPDDALAIATAVYDHSSERINELSAIAREDAIGYARDELNQAEDRLRAARVDVQSFRNRTQIIDPTIQTQNQSGLISALEAQLAEAQIDMQLLIATARASDPRITQTQLKIEVIERQIASERAKLGIEGGDEVASVADLVGEYEVLTVDLEFAQEAYTAARVAYDGARNEARRQSRYLTAHVNPTRAEQSKYPERATILSLSTLFLFLFWSAVVLVAYALRDRR